MLGKATKVSRPTVDFYRKNDPDFDAQILAAEEHAVELASRCHDAQRAVRRG